MNQDVIPSNAKFIAAFAQSNEGDVSPNTFGSFCTGTDIPCDATRETKCPSGSKCNGRYGNTNLAFSIQLNLCIRGPGWEISDIESNRIIGENQALKAMELYLSSSIEVEGTVDYAQRYWDITKTIVTNDNDKQKLCAAAMVRVLICLNAQVILMTSFYCGLVIGLRFW